MNYAATLKDRRFQRIIAVLLDPAKKRFPSEPAFRFLQLRYWLCGPSPRNVSFDRAGACFGAAHIKMNCPQNGASFSSSIKTYLREADNSRLFNASFAKHDFLYLLNADREFDLSEFTDDNRKIITSLSLYTEANIFLRSYHSDYLEDDIKIFIMGNYKRLGCFSYAKIKELTSLIGEKGLFCAAAERTAPELLLTNPLDIDTIVSSVSHDDFHGIILSFVSTCSGLLDALGQPTMRRRFEKTTNVAQLEIEPLELLPLGMRPSFKNY